MARIFDGAGGTGDQQDHSVQHFSADEQDHITIPGSQFIADSEMTRDGQDLVLTSHDGSSVVIDGYFSAETAPMLSGPHGASLTPELVNSFISTTPQYAQAGSMNDESPVGAVEEMKGEATVTHADGSTEALTIGSPIYQGDVIQTTGNGAVNLVFADETSMAVSENARLAVDEYSFDPTTESGTTNFSVLRGVFVFTSGLIGRDDPDDVSIQTPVGSIGIRGTIIAGHINPQGDSEITVVEGAIVVKNGMMEKTLSVQYETLKLTGFESEMHEMGVLDAKAMGTAFGSVSDVAPSLFSAINDSAAEEGQNAGANDAEASEESSETTGEGENTPEGDADAPQDMQMNDATDTFGNNVFAENAAKQTTAGTTQQSGAEDGARTAAPAGTMKMAPAHSDAVDNTVRPPTATGTKNTQTQNTEPAPLGLDDANAGPGVHRISDNYSTGNNIGFAVTAIGDANGDGYDDFMFSNNSTLSGQNHSYVVYGAAGGVPEDLLTNLVDGLIFSLNDPDSDAGDMAVITNPSNPGNTTETVIRGIGDFDGDGVTDYMIGQQSADGTNAGSGVAYIVSGANPAQFITLNGLSSLSYLGASISALGDINNDGHADVLVGAPGAGAVGQAYVLYGGLTTMGASVDLSALGGQGYTQFGAGTNDSFGSVVVGLGDFNGDGYVDYAVGAPNLDYSINTDAGKMYIYSGADNTQIMSVTGYSSAFLLTLLGAGTNHHLGSEIFKIGDINGDGLNDVMFAGDGIGREAYILFGGTNSNLNVGSMGSSGFKITVPSGSTILGGGEAGDFNGDGFDDFAIAIGNGADANIYVVYGSNSGHGLSGSDREFSLTDLNNSDYAFKMAYAGGGTLDFTFSSGGDTNGDGFDDLLIGAENADGGYGEVLVVDGREDDTTTYVYDGDAHDANPGVGGVAADANGQTLIAAGNDSMADDGQTNINFRGSNGDNTIYLSHANFQNIDGGLGYDSILLEGPGNTLDLRSVNAGEITQVENIRFGSSGQTITLSVENIFNMLRTADDGILKINYDGGGSNGLLNIDANTASGAANASTIVAALNEMGANVSHNTGASAGAYEVFDIGGYQLYIDDTIMSNATVI